MFVQFWAEFPGGFGSWRKIICLSSHILLLLFFCSLNHIFINFIWSTKKKKNLTGRFYWSLSDKEINYCSFYCLIGIDLWSSTTKEFWNHSPIGIPLWFLLEWKWYTLWLSWNFFLKLHTFSLLWCIVCVHICMFVCVLFFFLV